MRYSLVYTIAIAAIGLSPTASRAESPSPSATAPTAATTASDTAPPVETAPPSKSADDSLRVYWKSGLRLEGLGGDIALKLGARLLNDWAWFVEDNGVNSQDGTSFRAARLELEGTFYENVSLKFQYDFASSSPFKDVFLGYHGIPGLGTLKIGHFKEPFSLNELTSSKHIALMERGLPNALVPGRNTGVAFQNAVADGRMTYAAGMFRDADGLGKGVGDTNYALTARTTALPYAKDDDLIHVGVAGSFRNVDDTIDYSAKPESNLASTYLKSGDLDVARVGLVGGELAAVFGPTHVAAEYIGALHDGVTEPTLHGGYIELGYLFTGESRPYDRKSGAFKGVKPSRNALRDGAGAWEAVARLSRLDFDDAAIAAGTLLDFSAGLNWYLNPHARIMLDYVLADLDGRDPGHIVQSRFQVDF